MHSIYYKRLFEIRILHEYFLTEDMFSEYFSLSDVDREAILNTKLYNNQYDISKYLYIEPTKECTDTCKDLNIKLISGKTGFFAAMKVKPQSGSFKPFSAPPPNTRLTFNIGIKDHYFRNLTSMRIDNFTPSIYYFNNENSDGAKVFPSICSPVAAEVNGKFYEQGEIAIIAGDRKMALEKSLHTDPAKWKTIISEGLVHEGDRMLVPDKFYFTFEKSRVATQASFFLKRSGVLIKQIDFSQPDKLTRVYLNFNNDATQVEPGMYELEISEDNGYTEVKKVYINSTLHSPAGFGIVDINFNSDNGDFNILNADGTVKLPAPVFEIRLKSRISYWRYKSSKRKNLDVTLKTSPYLVEDAGTLRTKHPLPLTYLPLRFKDIDPMIEEVFLPNPSDASLKPENDGKIYSDIYLTKIKELIVEV